MDKLKLRYLIREAIENVANVTSKFSVGDKVTTVDGDTANVTMAEHPFYTVELEETGTTKSFNFKDFGSNIKIELNLFFILTSINHINIELYV